MEYGLIVTVLCLTIVFGVLILLVGALQLMKYLSVKSKNKDTDLINTDQIIEDGDESVIAAITAAVSIVMHSQSEGKQAKFIVRSIKRI